MTVATTLILPVYLLELYLQLPGLSLQLPGFKSGCGYATANNTVTLWQNIAKEIFDVSAEEECNWQSKESLINCGFEECNNCISSLLRLLLLCTFTVIVVVVSECYTSMHCY